MGVADFPDFPVYYNYLQFIGATCKEKQLFTSLREKGSSLNNLGNAYNTHTHTHTIKGKV